MINETTRKYLEHLGLECRQPSLQFLNELVNAHQIKVPWENLTKIIDYEHGKATGEWLPSFEKYVHRLTQLGTGGTCWTLAVGFRTLLDSLGFNVSFLYMDSGHICLRVDLDQPYYVDIGYSAPLFCAYPLFESFEARNEREHFEYKVNDGRIDVIRTPGPTKILDPKPRPLDHFSPMIERSNRWETSAPLQSIFIYGYIDGVITSLIDFRLKRYIGGEVEERQLTEEQRAEWVDRFGIDQGLYEQAKRVFSLYSTKS